MKNQDKTIDQIYDLFAVRILVSDIKDCYAACREALSGKNNIDDFIFFHADYYVDEHDEWVKFSSWYKIEGHIFFKRSW